ncbi:heme oxygenase [Nitzschia inconspicua]|uniref:Heme oxygenase n=1 Tax=Nitzschia inconspicua TaxID=303405 RepID=A0A9K3KJP8_9STRA|nr:heme oxygenase [Nitzschia inconspicua]
MTTTPRDASLTPPLTQRINDTTKDVHEKSGNSINWKLSLILTSKECYCEAISLFWIVYREIERLYDKHVNDHKVLQLLQPVAIVFQRAPKAERDIRTLMPSPEQAQELLERRCSDGKYTPRALQDYVDRLERIAAENPVQLVAYLYAMNGAITGGGVAIQKMVQKTFGLKTLEGVELFELNLSGTSFASGREAWKEFKRILDEDAGPYLTDEDIDLILKEAPKVFDGNNALVATVQQTRAFGKAAADCTRRLGIVLAVVIAVVAAAVLYTTPSTTSK